MRRHKFVVILVIGTFVAIGITAGPAWRNVQFIWALATFDAGCGIRWSGEGDWQITAASDPSRRIPRWTDDGQGVVFDFPGTGRDPSTGKYQRDSIYIVDSHGVELKEWTPADAPSSSNPFYVGDYAPDVIGDKVAFTTLRHACDGRKRYEIASAELDGSGYRRLTDADGSDLLPAWSPDGSRIAFVSNRSVASTEVAYVTRRSSFNVYVMDANGSNVRSPAPDLFITTGLWAAGSPYSITPPPPPVWSPIGELAFRDNNSLYTVHPDKQGVATVGQVSADPAWSPDGEWIAWAHSDSSSIRHNVFFGATIYVARSDGSETRRVYQMSSTAAYEPTTLDLSWAPDGQSLRFVFAPRHLVYGLYQISLDEPDPQLITEVVRLSTVVWSPDGSSVLVSNLNDYNYPLAGQEEEMLYTVTADGSDKRVLVKYNYNGLVAANGE